MIERIKTGWDKYRTRIREWVDKTLEGTHNHFFCYLPGNLGFLSSFILKLFFSGIKINEHQVAVLKNIPENATVVYVTKYKNNFEHLLYHTRYRQEGLPFPEIGLDHKMFMWQPVSRIFRILLSHIDYLFHNLSLPDPYESGYIRQELVKKRSALLSLVDDRGFYRRFVKTRKDPVEYLVKTQQSIDRPIYIIPQLLFFGKKPEGYRLTLIDFLFGSVTKPGKIRRLITLLNKPYRVISEISEPLNLQEFLKLAENQDQDIGYQAILLRRRLLDQINRHHHSITGPLLKSKAELKEDILTGDSLRSYMDDYAKQRDMPIRQVHKKANKHLNSIAAKYNPAVITLLSIIIRWIINSMFDGVTVNHDVLNRIKIMSHKGPLIFIPCHKSHIDYLILSYIMYNNNMPCPHIAAGDNLSFFPLGTVFRRGGAFFLRRSFKGAPLYSKVFGEYTYKLLEEGFNIEFFIEGGRSRTGKLILPKLGFLSILLNAFRNGACKDMILVPVYVGYDRVLEESSYIHELEGGKKDPENLSQVIRARRFLKKRYGKIYINFHDPISLNKLTSQSGSLINEMTPKELNTFCRNMGFRIVNAIDKVSVVTPHALVAGAILNCSKVRFSFDHLMFHIETYINYLLSQDIRLSETLSPDPIHAARQVLDSYVQSRFIECIPGENHSTDDQFLVHENKRPILEYYKNNCVIFFIPAAFTALSILEKDAFQFSTSDLCDGYGLLQQFFKYEFAYDIDRSVEHMVQKNIRAFLDDSILMPQSTHPDAFSITPAGYRKLATFSAFLKTYFESYWISLKFFKQYPQDSKEPIESMEPEERLKKIMQLGNQMYRNKEIERKEAVIKANFKNAVNFFIDQGTKSRDIATSVEFYTETIKKYMNYL